MPKPRSKSASSPRREELLSIAAKLFAKKGYRATSVRDIAGKADILSGSLFHHFDSKEEILDELIRPFFAELVERSLAVENEHLPPRETVVGLVTAYITMMKNSPDSARIIYNDWNYIVTSRPYLQKGFAELDRVWTDMMRSALEEGLFRDDVDYGIVHRLVLGSLTDVINWFDPKGPMTIPDIAEQFATVLLDGVSTKRRRPLKES
jgi:AcrR family transcriptional regulator